MKTIFALLLLVCAAGALSGQEMDNDPFVIFLPVGYDFTRLEDQTVHTAAGGIGFILSEQGKPWQRIFCFGAGNDTCFFKTEVLKNLCE